MTTTPTTTATVDRLLDAIAHGDGIPTELFAPTARLDATVPGWRFPLHGPEAICAQYGRWFADPSEFAELERRPFEGGETVTYLLTWTENGVQQAARHCHIVELDADGRIASDTFFCGGRWDAGLLARMAAEAADAG